MTIFRSDEHFCESVTKKPVALVVTGFFLIYIECCLSSPNSNAGTFENVNKFMRVINPQGKTPLLTNHLQHVSADIGTLQNGIFARDGYRMTTLLTGLFLGAGASYEANMPLVWGLTSEKGIG